MNLIPLTRAGHLVKITGDHMSYLLNMLSSIEYEPSAPGLEVIEPQSVLDENLARLAFEEAERALVRQGFAEMDDMGHYAEPRAETLKVIAYAPQPIGASVDRIDNDKGYSPENCRWATSGEQARNKRTSRILEWQGESLCLSDWAKRIGIAPQTLAARLDSGLSVEIAFTVKRSYKKPIPWADSRALIARAAA